MLNVTPPSLASQLLRKPAPTGSESYINATSTTDLQGLRKAPLLVRFNDSNRPRPPQTYLIHPPCRDSPMEFAFTEEHLMIRDSAERFLAQASDSHAVRAAMSSAHGHDPEVW